MPEKTLQFCQVAVARPLADTYTYKVPEGIFVQAGMRVLVPFGQGSVTGVVTQLVSESAFPRTKAIRKVLDSQPMISPLMLEFTRWIADYYLAGWGEVLPLACPPSLKQKRDIWIKAVKSKEIEVMAQGLSASQSKSAQALLRLASTDGETLRDLKRSGLSPLVFSRAEEAGLLAREEIIPRLSDDAVLNPPPAPKLRQAQQDAVSSILDGLESKQAKTYLLHGVTGSGKTEVYLRAIAACIKKGKSAIVLVPEIALTPQTWRRFEARFPGLVSVLHSGLTSSQREQGLARLRSGEAKVALGPRSALFAPMQKLGMIVVDEESEPSYKQENTPRYHARDAALVRAKIEKAVTVLGSATPSFESWANAKSGKYTLLDLPARASGANMPVFEFLNPAEKSGEGAADDAVAGNLIDAVEEARMRGEQSLLFLNRRGFAPVMSCAKCGQAEQCPHCSISFTYHKEGDGAGWLRCHLCGQTQRPPVRCEKPKCQGAMLRAVGTGTQRLEEEIKRRIPKARIERVDRDTAAHWGFHKDLAARVLGGKVDVLVGTQMIAKGLDFPLLTQVGVVNADASLNFPDFRAGERTFQLLVQVAGRAGRADKPGKVWVQTKQSWHPCLQAAAKQDFGAFYQSEIQERRELSYPPYGRLASVIIRSEDKGKALKTAMELAEKIRGIAAEQGLSGADIMGPAPAPLIQIKQWWRYRLLIKTRTAAERQTLLKKTAFSNGPSGVQWVVDVDPVQFM